MKKMKYFIFIGENGEHIISHVPPDKGSEIGISNINNLMIFLNDSMQGGEKLCISTTEEANEMINAECWSKESCE
jgi:hypothetical protein